MLGTKKWPSQKRFEGKQSFYRERERVAFFDSAIQKVQAGWKKSIKMASVSSFQRFRHEINHFAVWEINNRTIWPCHQCVNSLTPTEKATSNYQRYIGFSDIFAQMSYPFYHSTLSMWTFCHLLFFYIHCVCHLFVHPTDMAKASANGTFIPEHNMSLHPYFNFDVQRNVTARVGQTTFLMCKVEQLGDKSVSLLFSSFAVMSPALSFCWFCFGSC